MKNHLKRILCLALCLCMALSLGVFASADGEAETTAAGGALDAARQADQWVYDAEGDYWTLDVTYCENPLIVGGKAVQQLRISAPGAYMQKNADGAVTVKPNGSVVSSNGVVYTAETAPIIYYNTSGGYAASSVGTPNTSYLDEGYVYVTISTRGKGTKDDSGSYVGQFPGQIVDLKAGIRYLKYNDAVLPGSSESIVSVGGSSGGAVSALLGVSGNSPVFEEYLAEIGAADATDDILVAVCWCPITNLNTNDAGYEWFMKEAGEYFLFNAMAVDMNGNDISATFPVGRGIYYPLGSNVLGGAHEDELSAWLINDYIAYVQGLGLDLGDDGRTGSYYDDLGKAYADGLKEYIERYNEFNTGSVEDYLDSIKYLVETDEDGEVVYYDAEGVRVYPMYRVVETIGRNGAPTNSGQVYYVYHDENGAVVTDESGNAVETSDVHTITTDKTWFTYDAATGSVTMTLDDYIRGYISTNQAALGNNTYVSRNKMCPSLDSYNYKSNENNAFITTDGTSYHFSTVVRDGLKALIDGADEYGWTGDELAYIEALYAAYAADLEAYDSDEMLQVMSSVSYVTGDEAWEGDIAPYFRWRIGSADGDQGAPAGWLTHEALRKYHPEVDSTFSIAWTQGHGTSEIQGKLDDVYKYIDGIMLKEGKAHTAQYSGQWEYHEDGDYWSLDKIVYCTDPVLPEAQCLTIYAPGAYMKQTADGSVIVNATGSVTSSTGVVYTATGAPIMMHNTSGGYSSSSIQPVNLDYLNEGYVQVGITTRGKETKSVANESTGAYTEDHRGIMDDADAAEGEYIGQFPAIIVDLKAGIRFLKYFDDELPGSSERIVSRGYSSGGAVSAMLGASGNSPIFDSYLEAIGAYDATDDIFITLASAPITNLSSADASYEWYQHANTEYFLFNAMAYDREGNPLENFPVGPQNMYPLGSNVLGGAHEDELSDLLYDWYVKYVQDLGFDLGDDGRSGEFYEGFAQIYADALAEFIARYDEVKDLLNTGRSTAPDTAEEYLARLGEGWFTYDPETGAVTMEDLDEIVTHHIQRKKMCPSLDSYNYKSNENDAFKDADGNTVHFSGTVRDALKYLLDNAETYGWTADELAYIQALFEDYDAGISEESTYMLEVMSPINYIVETAGFEGATVSPYWRLRVGSEDGDHGAPAAWLIAEGLKKYQPEADVSVGIAWGMGHSLSELTEQDLYDYIAAIMAVEDGLQVMPYNDIARGAWYASDVEAAKDLGLLNGYSDGSFRADATLTYAQAVKLAAVIHQSYATGGEISLQIGADTWYSTYMAYALENGIIGEDLSAKADEAISREEFVKILYKALPESEYAAINDGASFPDAAEADYAEVYALLRAGIVIGNDDGTFAPQSDIKRSEVAAIIVRMLDASARIKL